MKDAASESTEDNARAHDARRGEIGRDLQRAAGELRHVDELESQGSHLHIEGESLAQFHPLDDRTRR